MAIVKQLLPDPTPEQIDSSQGPYLVTDDANGGIAIDYSWYYNRMAEAQERTAKAAEDQALAAQAQQAAVEEIRDIINGTQQVTGGGIPMKDVYAALSYSALIKVFNEEGVDIDSLIEQTQTKLDGLSNAGDN